jgi:hypothetical protein
MCGRLERGFAGGLLHIDTNNKRNPDVRSAKVGQVLLSVALQKNFLFVRDPVWG